MSDDKRAAIFIPCLTGGGAETSMLKLAGGLSRFGYAVDFVVANSVGPDADDVAANLKQMPDGVQLIDFNAMTPRASIVPLIRYFRKTRPRAVISFGHNANVVSIVASKVSGVGVRTILSIQNNFSAEIANVQSRHDRLMVTAARFAYAFADVVTGVSQGVADDLAKVLRRRAGSVAVVYNPIVADDLFMNAAQPIDHPFFNDPAIPVVLSIGRLEPQKDYATLLAAIAEVRKSRRCRLVIFGQGYQRPLLEEQIQQLKIAQDVSLPGYTSNPYAYLAKASLFVLSSIHEGLPTVLIEALASGCPVVSTDCPSGPMEILQSGKWGELVAMGDSYGLAQAINRALDKPRVAPPQASWCPYTVDAAVAAYARIIEAQNE